MQVRVDWYSFTLPINLAGVQGGEEAYRHIFDRLAQVVESEFIDWAMLQEVQPRAGRGHYGAGLQFGASNFLVWFGGIASHVLFECSGQTCEVLREFELLERLIEATQGRCTRIDIACDMQEAG